MNHKVTDLGDKISKAFKLPSSMRIFDDFARIIIKTENDNKHGKL